MPLPVLSLGKRWLSGWGMCPEMRLARGSPTPITALSGMAPLPVLSEVSGSSVCKAESSSWWRQASPHSLGCTHRSSRAKPLRGSFPLSVCSSQLQVSLLALCYSAPAAHEDTEATRGPPGVCCCHPAGEELSWPGRSHPVPSAISSTIPGLFPPPRACRLKVRRVASPPHSPRAPSPVLETPL